MQDATTRQPREIPLSAVECDAIAVPGVSAAIGNDRNDSGTCRDALCAANTSFLSVFERKHLHTEEAQWQRAASIVERFFKISESVS